MKPNSILLRDDVCRKQQQQQQQGKSATTGCVRGYRYYEQSFFLKQMPNYTRCHKVKFCYHCTSPYKFSVILGISKKGYAGGIRCDNTTRIPYTRGSPLSTMAGSAPVRRGQGGTKDAILWFVRSCSSLLVRTSDSRDDETYTCTHQTPKSINQSHINTHTWPRYSRRRRRRRLTPVPFFVSSSRTNFGVRYSQGKFQIPNQGWGVQRKLGSLHNGQLLLAWFCTVHMI